MSERLTPTKEDPAMTHLGKRKMTYGIHLYHALDCARYALLAACRFVAHGFFPDRVTGIDIEIRGERGDEHECEEISHRATRLWVDDLRPAPAGWWRATTAEEALHLLATEHWDVVSLDHDLGDHYSYPEKTGYTIACMIEVRVATNDSYTPPKIYVHSANPVGAEKIEMVIKSIDNLLAKREEKK